MRYLKYVLVLGIGCLFAQCAKFEPEVVQFNEKYNPKQPTKGKRDVAPEVDLLHLYASFSTANATSLAKLITKDKVVTVKGLKSPAFLVEGSFPVPEDVTFTIGYDKERTLSSGKQLLPESAYTLPKTLTIVAGTQSVPCNIVFNEEEIKKLQAGDYSFYITLSSESKMVKFREGKNSTLVTLTVKEGGLPEGNNIEQGNPSLGTNLFNDGITFTSNKQLRNLNVLTDGQTSGATWWTDGKTTTLTGTFKSSVKIAGIVLYNKITYNSSALKSVRISVADESGEFVEQGIYTTPKVGVSRIKFKEPVEITQIKFDKFVSQTGDTEYIDIYEIQFAR